MPERKPMEHLADRVYILRHTKRMSQHELARAVGCSPTTISNLELKKVGDISIDHLVALARVLGASTDDLLGLKGEDEDDPAQAVANTRGA
jgi:transcriptional regulator with XRE-family HTH domain